MFQWFKTKNRIFWLTTMVLMTFIMGPATADGTFTDTAYQSGSFTVTGPEGTHVPPNVFPLFAGDTLTEGLSAGSACSGANGSGQECTIDSKTFSYRNVVVSYSPDGQQAFVTGVGSAGVGNVNSATGDATLTASFPQPGYYKITYIVHMDYTSTTCSNGGADSPGNLSFAVQAGDFDFSLSPGSIVVANGGSGTTNALITSYKGFSGSVGFSRSDKGSDYLPEWTVSGSGTASPNQLVSAPLTVKAARVPFSLTSTPYSLSVRGQSQIGSILLAHDHPLSVTVNFIYITGPYDGSFYKGPNGRTQNVRSTADGSITTDSVLSLQTKPLVNDPWRATSALTAKNTSGLPLIYDWSASYGVPSYSLFSSDQASFQVNQGDSKDPNGSFVTTTATATNSVSPDLQSFGYQSFGGNSYAIRWHHQYEGWQRDTTKTGGTFNKVIQPKSVSGLPLVGCGTAGPIVTYPVYDVDIDGLVDAGILVAALTIGAYERNPIYAGLVAAMPIELDKLNTEVKNATTTQISVAGVNVFAAGLAQTGALPTFYKDKNGQSINMNQIYGLNGSSSYGAILNCASGFTMVSTCRSVPYQKTFFVADEYGTQGYIGPHSQYVYLFVPGGAVVDCGVFTISQNAPRGA